jgi:hypothetical protein
MDRVSTFSSFVDGLRSTQLPWFSNIQQLSEHYYRYPVRYCVLSTGTDTQLSYGTQFRSLNFKQENITLRSIFNIWQLPVTIGTDEKLEFITLMQALCFVPDELDIREHSLLNSLPFENNLVMIHLVALKILLRLYHYRH